MEDSYAFVSRGSSHAPSVAFNCSEFISPFHNTPINDGQAVGFGIFNF